MKTEELFERLKEWCGRHDFRIADARMWDVEHYYHWMESRDPPENAAEFVLGLGDSSMAFFITEPMRNLDGERKFCEFMNELGLEWEKGGTFGQQLLIWQKERYPGTEAVVYLDDNLEATPEQMQMLPKDMQDAIRDIKQAMTSNEERTDEG